MQEHAFNLALEQDRHQGGVRALLNRAFGPLRMMRAVYRLREGMPPDPALCFVMENSHGQVLATLRNYRVRIGHHPQSVILLGPLAVAHSHEKLGLAAQLIHHAVSAMREFGFSMVYVVGKPEYYAEFGFQEEFARRVGIANLEAGKVILGLELIEGQSQSFAGVMQPDEYILLNQCSAKNNPRA